MKHLFFAVIFSTVAFTADIPRNDVGSVTISFEQTMPLVIIGEGWSQTFIAQCVEDTADRRCTGTLRFFTSTGNPWEIDFIDHARADTILFDLKPGQAISVSTVAKFHFQELGWAKLSLALDGLGDVLAQTIFRKQQEGRPDLMTSVLFSSISFDGVSLYFDNTDGKFAGVGVLNADTCFFDCEAPQRFQVTITEMDGTVLSNQDKDLGYETLWWFSLVHEYPETAGKRGIIHFTPVERFDGRPSGFSLQFTPNGAFTAITPFEN